MSSTADDMYNEDSDDDILDDNDNITLRITLDPLILTMCESASGTEEQRLKHMPVPLANAYRNALIAYQDAYPVMLGADSAVNQALYEALQEFRSTAQSYL